MKVMNNLITKSFEANEDPNWTLLAYRATPLSASLTSPVQMLHGRPLRTNLPPSGLLPRTMISRMLNIIVRNPTHNYQNHHYPNYNMGRVLLCTTTIPIHGNLLQLPTCYLLLDPTSVTMFYYAILCWIMYLYCVVGIMTRNECIE